MLEVILKNYEKLTEDKLPLRCQKIKDHFLMLYNIDANNIDKMWDKKALGSYTLYLYNLIICSLAYMIFV